MSGPTMSGPTTSQPAMSTSRGRLASQIRTELQLVARNGEQLLLTLGIPVLLLVFFSLVDVLPTASATPSGDSVDFLAPGVLALAVMSTAMVSLGIGTGFERTYLVLKRLGATPLGRTRLIVAKIVGVLVVELAQFVVLVPIAYALGWSPHGPNWALAVAAVALGTIAFAGIGLSFAGRLRGEINLAALNGIYLLLLLLGGMIIPFAKLPTPIRAVARVLPSGALADVLRDSLSGLGDHPGASWVVLAAWAVASPLIARRVFRFE